MQLDRTPWVIAPLEAVANPAFDSVFFVTGSQNGKTEGLLINLLGWCLDVHRKPCLYYAATQPLARSVSDRRIGPMIRSTPSLKAGLVHKRHDSLFQKFIYGARLGISWAGSASQLASEEAMIAVLDELDRMRALKGEGSPLTLAEGRVTTYNNGTVVAASSPTLGRVSTVFDHQSGFVRWAPTPLRQEGRPDLVSPIWIEWQGGTRHEFTTPCPRCGHAFVLRAAMLRYDEEAPLDEIYENTWVECPHCKNRIEETERGAMAAAGAYTAPGQRLVEGTVTGPEPKSRAASFWVSALFSPWRTWGRRVHDIVKARREGDPAKEQGHINTGLGECFAIIGSRPTDASIKARCGDYTRGMVPDYVTVLIGAVDLGAKDVWWLIRGFGPRNRSALIEYGMIEGVTRDPEGAPDVWLDLDLVMRETYGGLSVTRVGIDSGYSRDAVYAWCRTHRKLYWPLRGGSNLKRDYVQTALDLHPVTKRALPGSVLLTTFEPNRYKQLVRQKIDPEGAKAGSPGSWEVPSDIDVEYLAHMQAEEEIFRPDGSSQWVRHGPNHWWDTEVYTWPTLRTLLKGRPIPQNRATADAPSAASARPRVRGYR